MSPIKLPTTAAECVQAIRSPVMPDPETEAECVAFIREAFASSDRRTAIDIQNLLADVCQRGYATRAAIWNEHHLNKPPTARGRPQNPQIHSQKFEEIKKPAMSLTTFSPGLEKLCTELHQPVIRDVSGRHVTFIGLRLRRDEDEHPTYSQKLAVIAGLDTPKTGLDPGLDAGLATVQGKGLQELQELIPNIIR